ncbi:MAG: histidine phosphatase family protein [Butyrivibrio sp.]|nr:histidine phosphatase family protein [Butyrivibrio sp.]
MRIVFVRHGEPNYEKNCLTETGIVQAKLAADRLKEEGIEEIWSSPYGRAMETAEATAKVLGLPIKTLDFMKELDWGGINDVPIFSDGHPWDIADEMAKRGMDLNDDNWEKNEFFAQNRVVNSVHQVEKGIDEWLSELGYDRRGLYYDHKIAENEHRTVALFSHGGSSSAALAHILNLSFPYMCSLLHTDFTGITVVRMDKKLGIGSMPCLEIASDSRHIQR